MADVMDIERLPVNLDLWLVDFEWKFALTKEGAFEASRTERTYQFRKGI